jgi:predicted NBD/HSP70 family sugar kinase
VAQALVGVDIGGTRIRAVSFDDGLAPVLSRSARTPRGEAAIADVVVRLVGEVVGEGVGGLARVAVGIPGHVDVRRGVVAAAVNLGITEPVPLAALLSARLGVPVHVENDVNAAALGLFAHLGLERSASLAYVNVGTGIAAGFVLAGRLWRGVTGSAGEIGHVPMRPGGPLCPCGQTGCAEAIGSGRAVADDAARLDDVIGVTAWTVQLCVMTLDVDVVAVGGGMTNSGDAFRRALTDELSARAAASTMLTSLGLLHRLVLAPMGVPFGSLGAVLAFSEHEAVQQGTTVTEGEVAWRS